jgi:spore germination protein
VLGLLATIVLFSTPRASAASLQILAYETQDKISSQALKERHGHFNQLATDFYDVDSTGKITGSVPTDDLTFAKSLNIPTFATVSNFDGKDFNPAMAHGIITSSKATKTFLENATQLVTSGHYAGLNIDFESIANTDRSAFTSFVQTVATALRRSGILVILSVPAADKDDPSNSWTGAFDLKALGASADLLQVMTYDENGSWGNAGPVAGLDWVEAAIRYAVSVVPSSKISLGLPAFAYDWDLDDSRQNKQINWIDVVPLRAKTQGVAHWETASSSPNFTYMRRGHRHIVWHENAESIRLKAQLAITYKLAGISVWALGQENDAFWQAIGL